jgi:hypothetical protein
MYVRGEMRVLSGGFVHRGIMREGIQGDGWMRTRQHAGAANLIRDGNGHDDHLLP